MNDRRTELFETVRALLDQVADESVDPVPRISSAMAAAQYLEALTRSLVDDAREGGSSWDDLGNIFGTTGANVRARFGSYRDYGDTSD